MIGRVLGAAVKVWGRLRYLDPRCIVGRHDGWPGALCLRGCGGIVRRWWRS